jgi:hypothetical protein
MIDKKIRGENASNQETIKEEIEVQDIMQYRI